MFWLKAEVKVRIKDEKRQFFLLFQICCLFLQRFKAECCCSSVVEHFLGKEEVTSSSLVNSSKKIKRLRFKQPLFLCRSFHGNRGQTQACGDLQRGSDGEMPDPALESVAADCPFGIRLRKKRRKNGIRAFRVRSGYLGAYSSALISIISRTKNVPA